VTPSATQRGVEFNLPKVIVSNRVAYLKEFLNLSSPSIFENTLHVLRNGRRWLCGRACPKVKIAISLHKGLDNGCK